MFGRPGRKTGGPNSLFRLHNKPGAGRIVDTIAPKYCKQGEKILARLVTGNRSKLGRGPEAADLILFQTVMLPQAEIRSRAIPGQAWNSSVVAFFQLFPRPSGLIAVRSAGELAWQSFSAPRAMTLGIGSDWPHM